MRRTFYSLAVLACMAAGVIAPASAQADALLERGSYLMNGIVACGNCHTPKGPEGKPIADRELSGGFVIDAPVFHAVVPNITPDPDTGIGRWTDAQIVEAVRNGKRPDGSIIGPPMPIAFYRGMSDADVNALVAYLRQVKPISNKVEKSVYRIPLPAAYGPPVVAVPEVPKTDKVAYGHYLATGLGHCMDCHTPLVQGRNDMARLGAGGNEFGAPGGGLIASSNLTPANANGIAAWSDDGLKAAIRTGIRPNGSHIVPLMAFGWYRNISDDDAGALVAFLRTLKPAQ
ncbi:c-type cytochrome [Labrys monachus]|uniref:Mono/diheme cytochrome c family protein n=1 Tax=Labrys monachus TaxID=217067 RepID=A0ABU0FMH3_9HYPH|nr:c-type cytochrome [Labrys monachus]MDQ0395815.1 mono/diheme cytochrome c family protein [Labrys monachus]